MPNRIIKPDDLFKSNDALEKSQSPLQEQPCLSDVAILMVSGSELDKVPSPQGALAAMPESHQQQGALTMGPKVETPEQLDQVREDMDLMLAKMQASLLEAAQGFTDVRLALRRIGEAYDDQLKALALESTNEVSEETAEPAADGPVQVGDAAPGNS